MYEEKPKRNLQINWKSLLIKMIILFVVIFLIIWIISLVSHDEEKESNFNDNFELMSNAAAEYFTGSKLPQEINEQEIITLGEMFERKLLVEFQDEFGNSCDKEDSYAMATMIEEGVYRLEIKLVCDNESDTAVHTIKSQIDNNLEDVGNEEDNEEDDSEAMEEPSLDENPIKDSEENSAGSSISQNTNNNSSGSKPNMGNNVVYVNSVSLNYKRIVVNVGQSREVVAYIYPSNATNKTTSWYSSDPNIASVNNGIITGNKEGSTLVTVQIGEKKASVEVIVLSKDSSVTEACTAGSKNYVSIYPLALIVEEDCALSYSKLYQNYLSKINAIEESEYQTLYQEMKELGNEAGISITVNSQTSLVMNKEQTGYVGYQLFFTAKYKNVYSYKTVYSYYLDQNGNRHTIIDIRNSFN